MRVSITISAALVALAGAGTLGAQALRQETRSLPARVPAPVAAPAAAQGNPAFPGTQALFDGYVRDGKMPGIVAAFGIGDYPTQFIAAGRIATDAAAPAATPDTLWRVYSMTKPVTAMAAMILIEEGRIGLDDPLSKYIPAFARMRVLTSPDTSLDTEPAKSPITIRELLTHTSGLGYNINAQGPLLKLYEAQGIVPAAVNNEVEALARRTPPRRLPPSPIASRRCRSSISRARAGIIRSASTSWAASSRWRPACRSTVSSSSASSTPSR